MLQVTLIDCPFLTAAGSCLHVDQGVGTGELIVLTPGVCAYCAKTYPKAEDRHASAPVESWIFKERAKRKLPNKPLSVRSDGKKTAKRPNRCEHLGAVPISRVSCDCPRKHTYECNRFSDSGGMKLHVIPARQCETCNGYEDEETVGVGCGGCEQETT